MTCVGKDFTGTDEERGISGYITSNAQLPNVYIVCENCGCRVLFNKEEISGRKASGQNTSTPCHCGWHLGYPPEPWKPWTTSEPKSP